MAETGVSFKVPSLSKSQADTSKVPVIVINQQCDMDRFKTTELLMGWPIVSITVKQIQEFYEKLKSSSKIINWGCDVSEKLATAFYEQSAPIRATICPLLKIADMATSDVAEAVQKKIPVVTQSPWKVYDAVKASVCEFFAPLYHKVEFIVSRGEKLLRKAAISAAGASREFVGTMKNWMEQLEKYLESSPSQEVTIQQVADENSLSRPLENKSHVVVAAALNWTTTVAMFSVGAAAWVASRMPLVGQFVSVSPSPASSKSTSPTSDRGPKSSSSSYESVPELIAAPRPKMRRSMLNLERQGLE